MRVLLILALLIAAFAGYLWHLGGDSATVVEVADTAETSPAPDVPEESPAAPGVYYLTERVLASTPGGVREFPAGSKLERVGESGVALLLTDGSNTITVDRAKTTQDPAHIQAAFQTVSSTMTDDARQAADLEMDRYHQDRKAIEEKIGKLQDLIANEQTKIRIAKGEGSGSMRADLKNLSHGAKHNIQVAEGRIAEFQVEINAFKRDISALVPPSTPAPPKAQNAMTAAATPVAIEETKLPDEDAGLMSRIGLGFQRLLGKN